MNKSNTKPGKHTQNHFSFRLLLKMGVGMVFHETNRQEKHAVNHRFFTTQTMGPLVIFFWNLIIWSFFCSSWEWQIFLWWTMMRMEPSAVCTGLGEPLQPLILLRLGMARPVELGRDPWPFWVLHPPCIVNSREGGAREWFRCCLGCLISRIFSVDPSVKLALRNLMNLVLVNGLNCVRCRHFWRIKMVNVHPGDWSWKYEKQVCWKPAGNTCWSHFDQYPNIRWDSLVGFNMF
jgi:hypothetical protein